MQHIRQVSHYLQSNQSCRSIDLKQSNCQHLFSAVVFYSEHILTFLSNFLGLHFGEEVQNTPGRPRGGVETLI